MYIFVLITNIVYYIIITAVVVVVLLLLALASSVEYLVRYFMKTLPRLVLDDNHKEQNSKRCTNEQQGQKSKIFSPLICAQYIHNTIEFFV